MAVVFVKMHNPQSAVRCTTDCTREPGTGKNLKKTKGNNDTCFVQGMYKLTRSLMVTRLSCTCTFLYMLISYLPAVH